MLTPLGDVATLAAFLTGVVTILLQILKPLLEALPFMQHNEPVHDSMLRLTNLALQAGLLVLVKLTVPGFALLTWLDILALAFGQGMLAHAGYQLVRAGASAPSAPSVPDTTAPGV
jgi:hypothetical protein